jgi:hypothetical protein
MQSFSWKAGIGIQLKQRHSSSNKCSTIRRSFRLAWLSHALKKTWVSCPCPPLPYTHKTPRGPTGQPRCPHSTVQVKEREADHSSD